MSQGTCQPGGLSNQVLLSAVEIVSLAACALAACHPHFIRKQFDRSAEVKLTTPSSPSIGRALAAVRRGNHSEYWPNCHKLGIEY